MKNERYNISEDVEKEIWEVYNKVFEEYMS